MTSIALFGAGGKMGARLTRNLMGSPFEVRHVEVSEAGRARLRDELGITCLGVDDALTGVDVVILAVPDTLIGRIAAEISPKLAAGTMVISGQYVTIPRNLLIDLAANRLTLWQFFDQAPAACKALARGGARRAANVGSSRHTAAG